jgi:Xaa-Pro aminopeptidase
VSTVSVRSDRLVALLPSAGVDVLLVTDLTNVRYLTGYTGSNGIALIGPDTRTFVTDFRYLEQAAAEVDPAFDRRRSAQQLIEGVEDALPQTELCLGFEAAHMTVSEHLQLRERLPARVELVGTSGLVEELRAVKQPEEVAAIRAATALADEAFGELVAGGLAGRNERELATALEFAMRRRGAVGPSFEPIVAGGANGALPHGRPRDEALRKNELVVIDWGAKLDGYCSDCTRTLATGRLDAEGVARAAIEAAGHGEQFGHGLGHGVGLDVHEAPRLAQPSEAVLAEGNVVTVEPGVYIPGRFGVRIEDLVVVTGDGRDILTSISKELTVVD